jgi:receptor protein-tyrosine kinase
MSLVEQAARRLEELRRAGAASGGETAANRPASDTPAPRESTIERAARKLESLHAHRATVELRRTAPPALRDAPPANQDAERIPEPVALSPAEPLPPAPPPGDDILEWGEHARQEPRLGDAVAPELVGVPSPATLERPLLRDTPQFDALDRAPQIAPPARSAEPGTAAPAPLDLDLDRLSALGVLTPDRIDSALANQLRFIKRPLINAAQGKAARPVANANRIMVSSALPGEGKSFIALNIAMSIAMERDSRVLLIDADTTRPSLSAILGAPFSQGLLDLLTNPALAPAQTLLRTNVERLTFLPSGTPRSNATELLASEAMERLVESLASRYTDRILIFDAPPLLAAPEPPVLASYMGQIVVVVEAQRTTHKAVQHALAAVEGCPVVMTVLNKCQRNGGLHEYYSRAAS